MRNLIVTLGGLLLAACASTSERAVTGVGQAAVSPLVDLNLVHAHADIPPVLIAAQRAPYAVPEDWSCPAIADEIRELDAALGADLDTQSTAKNPSLIERGGNYGVDTAVGQVRGITDAVVPFRGWVRKLSG